MMKEMTEVLAYVRREHVVTQPDMPVMPSVPSSSCWSPQQQQRTPAGLQTTASVTDQVRQHLTVTCIHSIANIFWFIMSS